MFMLKRITCSFAFLWQIIIPLSAQANLVVDPGFEANSSCPDNISQIHRLLHWSSPNEGSTDYFHACASNEAASTPINMYGSYQQPRSGKGYAGIITSVGGYPHREYVQGHLECPMVKDAVYQVSFHISMANFSD